VAALRRRDALIASLLAAGAFLLYVLTLAPTVLPGDPGEFQFAPYLLGVVHPTGYPLYCLLGWAWSHLLPLGDVAFRMNLFSAFWAALAVGLLYPTALKFLALAMPDLSAPPSRLLAATAAAFFAVTPTFWSQAVIAEVYGLHLFFVVLLLYLLSIQPVGATTRVAPTLLAAGAFGLSLTHHRTTLLLAPAFLVYLWLVDRRLFRDWRLLPKALALVALPLVLYLYIPLRAPHTPYFHLPLGAGSTLEVYHGGLSGFIDFILGGPFGGSLDSSVDLGARLAMAWDLLRGEVGWAGLILALVGLARLAISRRWALLALTALSFLASVGFNLFYTIGDIFVLFIPAYLIVVLWLAVGAGTITETLARARPAASRPVRVALALLFFALPAWAIATHYAALDQSHNLEARRTWEAILAEPIPADAVLVSNDRNDIMPLWYLQFAGDPDPVRPDLRGLFPLITPDHPTLGHVLDLALATGRPVYLIKEMEGVGVKVETEAEGRLWRVRGEAAAAEPAHRRNLFLADAVALTGFDLSPHSPRPGDELAVSLFWQAQRPLDREYHTYVHLLDSAGAKLAQSDRQPGGVYYPATLWQPGERLRDDHRLAIPPDAPVGVYQLVAGMYALDAQGAVKALGKQLILGWVAVKEEVQTEPAAQGRVVGASFAHQIELLSYDTGRQDGALRLLLQWRCLYTLDADYSVFVHLLDAGGQIVAQSDGGPREGAYPTSVWDVGEVIAEERLLSLPVGLQSGEYRLEVGLYLPETGERLPVVGGGDGVSLEVP
jgi:hypothetical protein